MPEASPLLNVHEAAALLGVHPNTIRRWANATTFRGTRVGTRGDWRFTRDDLLTMHRDADAPGHLLDAAPTNPPSPGERTGRPRTHAHSEDVFAGGGEMGALMRAVDWSRTPVGPVETWPQSLHTTVRMLLHSQFPMFLWWGPELVQFYNDGYRPSFGRAGEKHPRAMGQRGAECWQEIWPVIAPQIDQVMATGVATWHENHLVPIHRNALLEEVYWTYTYTPVFAESGDVGGVLVVVTETTKQVIAERRVKLTNDLAIAANMGNSVRDVCATATAILATDPADIPFALIYLLDENGEGLTLAASAGLEDDPAARPLALSRKDQRGKTWPVWNVLHTNAAREVTNLAASFGALPGGSWPEATDAAYLLPLTLPNRREPLGVLIAGLSPRNAFDGEYRDFLASTARQVVAGIANATAHERETVRRRELEQARAEAETARGRLYDLFMQAPAFVAVLSGPELVFEFANPRYRQLVGEDRPLDGKPLIEAIPDIEPRILEIITAVATTGERFVANELPILLDWEYDGKPATKYLTLVYEPIFDTERKPDGLMCFGYDVTAQVEARRSVQEGEERFRTLADNVQNLAWMANPDGWIFWYNRRWYEYTGTTAEAMEGWGWQSVHDPDVLPQVLERWQRSIAIGEPFDMVFPLKGADGVFRPFLTRVMPVRDNDGNVARWVGTNTDITAQRTLERQKDLFIGIASHELKTPVTSIKGYTQLLQRRFRAAGDERASAMLDKLDTQVDKLAGLIAELLDSATIESGNVPLRPAPFDLNALIDEVVEEIQGTAIAHTIVQELAASVTLDGDRDRIGQVLTNLLTNAIKYSPQADRVVVRTERREGSVAISVQDFGIGIPVGQQPHIFDRFYRVDGESRTTYAGLGLGLYIAADFVRRHGGDIRVESEEGDGTTMTFSLPLEHVRDGRHDRGGGMR